MLKRPKKFRLNHKKKNVDTGLQTGIQHLQDNSFICRQKTREHQRKGRLVSHRIPPFKCIHNTAPKTWEGVRESMFRVGCDTKLHETVCVQFSQLFTHSTVRIRRWYLRIAKIMFRYSLRFRYSLILIDHSKPSWRIMGNCLTLGFKHQPASISMRLMLTSCWTVVTIASYKYFFMRWRNDAFFSDWQLGYDCPWYWRLNSSETIFYFSSGRDQSFSSESRLSEFSSDSAYF